MTTPHMPDGVATEEVIIYWLSHTWNGVGWGWGTVITYYSNEGGSGFQTAGGGGSGGSGSVVTA